MDYWMVRGAHPSLITPDPTRFLRSVPALVLDVICWVVRLRADREGLFPPLRMNRRTHTLRERQTDWYTDRNTDAEGDRRTQPWTQSGRCMAPAAVGLYTPSSNAEWRISAATGKRGEAIDEMMTNLTKIMPLISSSVFLCLLVFIKVSL